MKGSLNTPDCLLFIAQLGSLSSNLTPAPFCEGHVRTQLHNVYHLLSSALTLQCIQVSDRNALCAGTTPRLPGKLAEKQRRKPKLHRP